MKTKDILKQILSIILLIVGVVLIFNQPIRDALMVNNTNKYIVKNVSRKKLKDNSKKKVDYDFSSIKAVSTEDVFKSQVTTSELPVIGGVAIPDLEINLPIFKGLTNEALMYGAGTMKEDQQFGKGNYTLASHHVFDVDGASKMLFSPLEQAKEGMKIYITDKDRLYTYQISKINTVTPEHVEVINDVPGETVVTLITCADAQAATREIVVGKLVKTEAYKDADTTITKSFSKTYNSFK